MPSVSSATRRKGLLHVEVPLDGFPGWLVRAVVDDRGERPAVVELTVLRGSAGDLMASAGIEVRGGCCTPAVEPEVTGEMLRAIRLPQVRSAVERHLPPRVRRPRGASEERWLAWLAREYVELEGARGAWETLGERAGMTADQVRQALDRARNKGYLERPGRGRRGGRLTNKARELLEQKGETQ